MFKGLTRGGLGDWWDASSMNFKALFLGVSRVSEALISVLVILGATWKTQKFLNPSPKQIPVYVCALSNAGFASSQKCVQSSKKETCYICVTDGKCYITAFVPTPTT